MEAMRTITVKLPSGLAARLDARVKRRGIALSDVVRQALERHLDDADEGHPGSCLELAADLAGSLRGRADLASNPKHLRGYGRS
jgi:Arc/MetJ-type ribon-helix-helix transcriptional regulator